MNSIAVSWLAQPRSVGIHRTTTPTYRKPLQGTPPPFMSQYVDKRSNFKTAEQSTSPNGIVWRQNGVVSSIEIQPYAVVGRIEVLVSVRGWRIQLRGGSKPEVVFWRVPGVSDVSRCLRLFQSSQFLIWRQQTGSSYDVHIFRRSLDFEIDS